MKATVAAVLTVLLLVSVAHCIVEDTPGFSVSGISSYAQLSTSGASSFYEVELETTDAPYDHPIYLAQLEGSRYAMGYDYGVMAGGLAEDAYNTALGGIFAGIPRPLVPLVTDVFVWFCDWQWDQWLSEKVPQRYMDELSGLKDGGNAAGVSDLDKIMSRVLVLANLPSDLADLRYVFHSEMDAYHAEDQAGILSGDERTIALMKRLQERIFGEASNTGEPGEPRGAQCSMFGVWGDRTVNGDLFSARNLDWASDLGLEAFKTIMVWKPDDAIAHSAVGYACVWGALTGMSAEGLSVAEANLEVNEETFSGFPWLLRLRYIMEEAEDLAQAWYLWETTDNTVGFNHMVASASDAARGDRSHAALALETMKGYTGYFLDNDPREISAKCLYNNETITYGRAIPNALWRTNHGYDPTIRAHYLWRDLHAGKWSVERYFFAYEAFSYYERQNVAIDYMQAINITSILGDKGDTAYECQNSNSGENIISATFQPGMQYMWAAWENGSGSDWRPAACNTYVFFNMTMWF